MRFFVFMSILLLTATLLSNCGQGPKNELQVADETNIDQVDSMIIIYTEIIQTDSTDLTAFLERSKLYEKQQKLLLAIRDMEQVAFLDASNETYHNRLGSLFFRVANRTKAIESYINTLEINDTNEEANLMLGKIYYYVAAGDSVNRNASLGHLYNVVRQNNTNAEAYFFIARNYLEDGDTSMGLSALIKSVDADPDFYDGYITLGLTYAAQKDMKAIDYYYNALRIKPESAEALYNLGYFYQTIDSFNKAEKQYRMLLNVNNAFRSANYNLAYILYLREKYDEAIFYFSEAIKQDPVNTDAYYGRGLCFKNLGKTAEAKNDFESALDIDPSDELVQLELNKLM